MPIYEFYCKDCNRIFSFFSGSVNTEARPNCPKCHMALSERMMSRFSTIRHGEREEGDLPDLDESRLERAMGELSRDAESIDENDPRQAAKLMRKFSEVTGMNLGPQFEEALHRLEKGEDPEAIEEEMGDLLDQDPFVGGESGGIRKKAQTSGSFCGRKAVFPLSNGY